MTQENLPPPKDMDLIDLSRLDDRQRIRYEIEWVKERFHEFYKSSRETKKSHRSYSKTKLANELRDNFYDLQNVWSSVERLSKDIIGYIGAEEEKGLTTTEVLKEVLRELKSHTLEKSLEKFARAGDMFTVELRDMISNLINFSQANSYTMKELIETISYLKFSMQYWHEFAKQRFNIKNEKDE